MIRSNDVSSQLDWRPQDGRIAFHYAVQRFFADLLADLRHGSVASHLGRHGADLSMETDEPRIEWTFSLKVSTAPGLLPPSLYSDVMAQFYRWKMTGAPERERWVLITNYFLEPEMVNELRGLGVSCLTFKLDEPTAVVRDRLFDLVARLSRPYGR